MIPHNGTYNTKTTLLQVQQLVHFVENKSKAFNPNSFQSKSSKLKDDLIHEPVVFGN